MSGTLRACLVADARRANQERRVVRKEVYGSLDSIYGEVSACAASVQKETGQTLLAARYHGCVMVYVFPLGVLPRGRVYSASHTLTEQELRARIDKALEEHPGDRSVLVDTTLHVNDRFPLEDGTDLTAWYDPHGKRGILVSQQLIDTEVALLCYRTKQQ